MHFFGSTKFFIYKLLASPLADSKSIDIPSQLGKKMLWIGANLLQNNAPKGVLAPSGGVD